MLQSRTLTGLAIRLEPLSPPHDAPLAAAASDAAIWRHVARAAAFGDYLATARAAIARGEEHAFAVIAEADGAVIGMTRLMDISAPHLRCEIGHTWYVPEVWGTRVNPEAKLLLMTLAFEKWGMRRVQLKTDHENLRSQAAIARLGAVREGVLRAHMVRPDGSRRDTVMFSVTDEEWPEVKRGLERRLLADAPMRGSRPGG